MINTEMRVRCRAVNVKEYAETKTSRARWTPWKKNLVFDAALNAFAGGTGNLTKEQGASSFAYCQVGTSAAAQTFQSGGVTFTQVGTTITASSTFFTAAMVGAIFKYGNPGTSNGAEQYIVSQTGTSCVVSGAGMTVGTPTPATVFLVQQTALTSPLLSTNSYQTTGSSCGTVTTGNVQTFQRTFNFPVQGSPYNANEIGWRNIADTTYSFGRLVLASTIVVAPTQFLQVQLQMVVTYSPGSPMAVSNVGTIIDTSGTAMLEYLSFATVTSTGNTDSTTVGIGLGFFGGQPCKARLAMQTATYTQNSAPTNTYGSAPAFSGISFTPSTSSWVNDGSNTGVCTLSFLTQTASTAGQTIYGIGITSDSHIANLLFDVKLTTPYVAPTGTFQPQIVFTLIFTRTLVC